MDEWTLKRFFCELIELTYRYPGRPNFGSPTSWLVEQMCVYQHKFISRIIGDYTGGESHECRLNNAGLKMLWSVERSSPCSPSDGFKCTICGDQAKDYPDWVVHAKEIIKKYGYNKR